MVCSLTLWIRHFVSLFLVMALLSSGVLAQAEQTTEPDLQAMEDVELEQICTNLGFALQKDIVDDATGELIVFTHDDYVEAARQCLSIEKELEEVLAEHPEILEEMEAERNRMLQEKERLEQELEHAKQRQAEVSEKPLSAAFIPATKEEAAAKKGEEQQVATPEKIASEEATNTTDREAPDTPQQQTNVAALEEERKVQTVLEVLDELFLSPLPQPVKKIIRQVLSQMKDDVRHVVRLIRRHADPLIGQLVKTIRMRIKDSDNPVAASLKAIFDKPAASLKVQDALQEPEQAVGEQSAPVV